MKEIQEKIGATVRRLREERGLNQDVFARKAGLNRVHLYRIELGQQSMTIRTLKIVADTLGVRIRDLFVDV